MTDDGQVIDLRKPAESGWASEARRESIEWREKRREDEMAREPTRRTPSGEALSEDVLTWGEVEWVGPYRLDGVARHEDDWVSYADGPINGDGEAEATVEGHGPTIVSAISDLRRQLEAGR